MKIHFHGAVRTVTGSLHLIETSSGLVALDCGMFQGRRAEARARNEQLPVPPASIAAAVLSHAHIDHIGNLPTWVKRGMKAPVFCTRATADLAALLLRDSAHIQELDAAYLNKKERSSEPVVPLYTAAEAEDAIKLLRGLPYGQPSQILPNVSVSLHDAGHILGSAAVFLEQIANGTAKRLLYTGDVGRRDAPILRDPVKPPQGADACISESTYGDREHPAQETLAGDLLGVVQRTVARGGKVLIPAFAVGRAQSVIYDLHRMQHARRLPRIPVVVDSPLACGATEVFEKHPECYDDETAAMWRKDGSPFQFDGFACSVTSDDSKALNSLRGPAVFISPSGMCEAGRVLHHLKRLAGDSRNTILIVGFQAEHTLGWRIVHKPSEIKVLGEMVPLRAEVVVLNGFSAHAGRDEMLDYLRAGKVGGTTYLVHGDERRIEAFRQYLRDSGYGRVEVPTEGQQVEV